MLTTAVALVVHVSFFLWRRPETDAAHGLSVLEFLGEPYFLAFTVAPVAFFGSAGFVLAVTLLSDTDLRESVPWGAGITVLTAALVPHPLLAAPLATLAGTLAMLHFWRRSYRRRSTRTT